MTPEKPNVLTRDELRLKNFGQVSRLFSHQSSVISYQKFLLITDS